MILTREAHYALELLRAIGEGCGAKPLSLQQFAEEADISFLFLQRIARKLRGAGLIKAKKGITGGYWLARKRSDISVADVLGALENDAVAKNAVEENIMHFLKTQSIQ